MKKSRTKISLLTLSYSEAGRDYYYSSAWHNYEGTPDAMTTVHNTYPDKAVFLTEFNVGGNEPYSRSLRWVATTMINSFRNWAEAAIYWNLALNSSGGPAGSLENGCSEPNDCTGVVTVTGAGVVKRPTYYALGHFSKFIKPGAWRIDSNNLGGDHLSVAFQNPDCSIALVVYNSAVTPMDFSVRQGRKYIHYTGFPGESLATIVWQGSFASRCFTIEHRLVGLRRSKQRLRQSPRSRRLGPLGKRPN